MELRKLLTEDPPASTNHGWPWGANSPTLIQRSVVASVVAVLASLIIMGDYRRDPTRNTDFSQVWFSANALLEGRNPYELVGPGQEFEHEYPLFYPVTAMVAAIPLAPLSNRNSSLVFVAISSFLLAFGITSGTWHRLPMLLSAAFIDSVHAAQWTMILTAAIFIPWVAVLAPAKPQSAIPVLAASVTKKTVMYALIGGTVLLALSFALLPGWLNEWLPRAQSADHIRAPLMGPVGFLILPVLFRWRRWETWLVIGSACMPQTFMWYSALILLATAATYHEAIALSLISTLGFGLTLLAIELDLAPLPQIMWTIYLCTTFVPVVVAILRRPNEGLPPVWLGLLRLRSHRVASSDP